MFFKRTYFFKKEEKKTKKIGEKETSALNNTKVNKKVSSLLYLEKTSVMNIFSDTKGRPVLRKSFRKMLMFFLNRWPL